VLQSTTSNLSTKQRLGFVISQVLVALHGLALLVKLIGSKVMKKLEKVIIGIFLTLGTSVLLVALYYFVESIFLP
jgi:hypothetical protein